MPRLTEAESHYLNCQDENCEAAFCVDRRFFTTIKSQLIAERDSARTNYGSAAIRIGQLRDRLKVAVEALEYSAWPGHEYDFLDRVNSAKEALAKIRGKKE